MNDLIIDDAVRSMESDRLVRLARADRRRVTVTKQHVQGQVAVAHVSRLGLRVTVPVEGIVEMRVFWKQVTRFVRIERHYRSGPVRVRCRLTKVPSRVVEVSAIMHAIKQQRTVCLSGP